MGAVAQGLGGGGAAYTHTPTNADADADPDPDPDPNQVLRKHKETQAAIIAAGVAPTPP